MKSARLSISVSPEWCAWVKAQAKSRKTSFGRFREKFDQKHIFSCIFFKKTFPWGHNVTVEVTVITIKEYGENYIKS